MKRTLTPIEVRMEVLTALYTWNIQHPDQEADPVVLLATALVADLTIDLVTLTSALRYLTEKGLITRRMLPGQEVGLARITAYGQDVVEQPADFQRDPIAGPLARTIIVNAQGATIGQAQFGGSGNIQSGHASIAPMVHGES